MSYLLRLEDQQTTNRSLRQCPNFGGGSSVIVCTGSDLNARWVQIFGASMREVARAANVAPSTVLRWERQSRLPKCPTGALRNILKVMSVRLME